MHVYFVYSRPKNERLYDYKRIIPFDITMKLAIAILKIYVIFHAAMISAQQKSFVTAFTTNALIDHTLSIIFSFFLIPGYDKNYLSQGKPLYLQVGAHSEEFVGLSRFHTSTRFDSKFRLHGKF